MRRSRMILSTSVDVCMYDPCGVLFRVIRGILALSRFSAGPQVGESHAFDEPIPDVEKVFREMLGKGVRPTRITIRVVEKVLGRRVVKRVLEELDVDEMLLGDLSAAYFQRRRALVAPRAQECERQKRRSYLRPTQTLAAADQKTSAHCRRAICRFAPPSKELVETRDSGQEDQNGTPLVHQRSRVQYIADKMQHDSC